AITQTQDSIELKNVSLKKSNTQFEVILEFSNKATFESFTLFNPNRIILDLLGVKTFSNNPYIDVKSMGIKGFRTAKNQTDVTRFIIDLDSAIPQYSISQSGNNISIILIPENEPPLQKKEEKTPEQKPAATAEVKPSVTSAVKTEVKQEETKPREKKERNSNPSKKDKDFGIGLKGGILLLKSEDFKEIYGNQAAYAGLEVDYFIHLDEHDTVGVALAFSYTPAKGNMTLTEEEVNLTLVPISLSAVYRRNFVKFHPYVALGIDYLNYKETLPEAFPESEISGFMWGYNFQLGTYFNLTKSISLNASFEYHNAKKTDNTSVINLNGLKFGIGIFYIF
ncbi:MAG: AMIN domain-containing protein, partial [Candidatus Aminicenantes bacterium]|nr:AMIN domain-containing protein [Candidatus Aminicenantes bacterium]